MRLHAHAHACTLANLWLPRSRVRAMAMHQRRRCPHHGACIGTACAPVPPMVPDVERRGGPMCCGCSLAGGGLYAGDASIDAVTLCSSCSRGRWGLIVSESTLQAMPCQRGRPPAPTSLCVEHKTQLCSAPGSDFEWQSAPKRASQLCLCCHINTKWLHLPALV